MSQKSVKKFSNEILIMKRLLRQLSQLIFEKAKWEKYCVKNGRFWGKIFYQKIISNSFITPKITNIAIARTAVKDKTIASFPLLLNGRLL